MKPIRIDTYTEKCPKCGTLVKYVQGLGTYTYGASESYEDWTTIEYKYCPNCGAKINRGKK